MARKLVIVESPSKAKTIKKFLGPDFEVRASAGHIVDLPLKGLGINVRKRFAPRYEIIKGKENVLAELRAATRDVEEVYLAPDPDREGEAISWHLANVLDLPRPRRAIFNEITSTAVQQGIAAPRAIDPNLVNAQQARRILDRLVGYKISPILWRKVLGNTSAGRVQSVALRLICEREKEIRAFVPVEYWTVTAHLTARGRRGGHGGAGADNIPLWPALRPRGPAADGQARESRAGRPRGHPPDRRDTHAGGGQTAPDGRSGPALYPGLAALRRQPDGARGAGHDGGRDHGGGAAFSGPPHHLAVLQ